MSTFNMFLSFRPRLTSLCLFVSLQFCIFVSAPFVSAQPLLASRLRYDKWCAFFLLLLVIVVLVAACCFRLIFFHVFIFVLCLRAQRLYPSLSLSASSRFPFTKFDCYKFVPDKISHVFFLGSKPPLQPFGTDFILAFSSYINRLKLIIQILQTKGGTQQKSIVINLNRRQVEISKCWAANGIIKQAELLFFGFLV